MKYTQWSRPGEWKCWSCKEWVSNIELSNADGFCPHCDQEIDTTEYPYETMRENDQ